MRKQIIAILLGVANVAAPIFAQEISGVCTGIFTNLVGNENLNYTINDVVATGVGTSHITLGRPLGSDDSPTVFQFTSTNPDKFDLQLSLNIGNTNLDFVFYLRSCVDP